MKSIALVSFLAAAVSAAFAQNASSTQIANLSTSGLVGSGAGSITTGFIVSGTAAKDVLVRGTGPGLATFGDANPAATVTVNIYDASGNLVTSDDGTMTDPNTVTAAASVGAFPQSASGQGDSALITSLAPGAYTIEIASTAADSPNGDALLEVYDLDTPGNGSAIINDSSRGEIGANAGTLTGGFVISGTASKNVLVRGVGLDLAAFGETNPATSVDIYVFDANGNVVASNSGFMNDPNASYNQQVAANAGAFALTDMGGSELVVSLPPGAYTVQAVPTNADAPDGVALLEVYDADAAVAAATPSGN